MPLIFRLFMHRISKGEKMKNNEKDPYNFEKIDGFLKERKREIGEKKQMYGKIYQKSPKSAEENPDSAK